MASSSETSAFGNSATFARFDAVDKERGIAATLNHDTIDRARALAGYGALVTSEPALPDDDVVRTYRRLCEGAEAFRDTLAQLEDTPSFEQCDTVASHLVVCYTSVLLMRPLETHVLGGRFSSDEVIDFTRTFEIVRASDQKFVNLARRSDVVDAPHEIMGLPIKACQLSEAQCNRILSYRLKGTKDRA